MIKNNHTPKEKVPLIEVKMCWEFKVMNDMNSKNLLIWLFLLAPVMAFSQDYSSAKNITTTDSASHIVEADAEMTQTIFYNESGRRNQRGCALIQNPWRHREMEVTKNGYKIVTLDEDETVKVKNLKNGKTRVIYSNDYETLKYKTNKNGEATYRYSYYNGCKKVRLKKDKKGTTSLTNKSGLDTKEVRDNAWQAINRGVRSCQNMSN